METLYLAADHAGFKLKEQLKPRLNSLGLAMRDLTPSYRPGDDYPGIGRDLARKTVKDKTRGILVCGSGVGVAIAANRVKGARAVEAHSTSQMKRACEHNDVNVLRWAGGRRRSQAYAAREDVPRQGVHGRETPALDQTARIISRRTTDVRSDLDKPTSDGRSISNAKTPLQVTPAILAKTARV